MDGFDQIGHILYEIIRTIELLEEESINLKNKSIKLKIPAQFSSNHKIVFVNKKFDISFSKEEDFYIKKGGTNQLKKRYDGVEKFIFGGELNISGHTIPLKPHSEIEASLVSVNRYGQITFTDGRHRYAYFRDNLNGKVPVAMDNNSILNANKFGYLS